MPETFKFELVGPHAGKTISLGQYDFEEGVYSYSTSEKDVPLLKQYLARWHNAHPVGSEELEAAKAAFEDAQKQDAQEPRIGVDVETIKRYVEPPPIKPATETEDEAKAPAPKPTIAEALKALHPGTDDHWTGLGLPAVEYVSRLTGEKVTRADIDKVAPDFNRKAAEADAALN